MDTKAVLTKAKPEEVSVGDTITWGMKLTAHVVVSISDERFEVGTGVCIKTQRRFSPPFPVPKAPPFPVPKDADIHIVKFVPIAAEEEEEGVNPKDALGVAKPSLSVVPPVALFHMAQAMRDGKEKYGHMNWRVSKVNATIYYDAAQRHLMSWLDGEDRASDSGVHHLAHAMACLGIILDAESVGKLHDDRPAAGNLPAFIQANTKDKT